MAIKSLVKDKNFLLGLIVGVLLTFGSSYIPIIGNFAEIIFGAISKISPLSAWGFFGDFIHAYFILIIVCYLYSWLMERNIGFVKVSLGFIIPYILFFILALFAISHFNFTQ